MDFENMQNRGFCFVECYNHAAADLARRTLSRPDFKLKDRSLTVTWAEPRRMAVDNEKVRSFLKHVVTFELGEICLCREFARYSDGDEIARYVQSLR